MKILIIGAEQLGYFLSKSLLRSGHKVTIIDLDPVRCEQIANTFDVTTYCGDGTRVETLAAAGAGKCDVLIAVTNRDEDNLIACELGKKQFGIARTIAQSNNSSQGATLYVTSSPCIECAKLIIQSGIKRVVFNEIYRLTDGIDLLTRAGIECVQLGID